MIKKLDYTIAIQDTINKNPGGSSDWFMSTVEGTVTNNNNTVNGVGLVEYIKD